MSGETALRNRKRTSASEYSGRYCNSQHRITSGTRRCLVRSAGNFAQLTSREGKYCVIKLPSGEVRQILSTCKATIGSVGNSDHGLEVQVKLDVLVG